jgi:redox-sensitive bicupin YhaK (pirin superfamily)
MYFNRKSSDRGFRDHGWLQTYHTFSFGDYDDAQWRMFGSLRVLNEDFVQPGRGFGTHPHRDMEILTYVISGILEHKDSMGNGTQIKPREMQYMSAGTSVLHSEFNPSPRSPVHLLQIWIIPKVKGLEPRYDQITLQEGNGLHLVAAPEENEGKGVIKLRADAWVYEGRLLASENVVYKPKGTHQWLHMVEGKITLNGHVLDQEDSLGIQEEPKLEISALEESTFLLFDMRGV